MYTPDKADVTISCSKCGKVYTKPAGTTKPCPYCGASN